MGRLRHGKRKTRAYQAWKSMRQRCLNVRHADYPDYGGRGITICTPWLQSFLNFLADMGDCPAGLTLDRINNDGNYEPDNCRWATQKDQARNRRRNRFLTYNGRTVALAALAEEIGINDNTLRSRLERGWKLDDAVCTE